MIRSTERRSRERRENRLRIVDAARELFAAGGEEALTLRRVAERIEYSATAIYLHFPNKEALVRELCAEDFAAFSRKLVQADRTADPLERLRRVAAGYVDFGLQYPAQYRAMFISSGAGGSPDASDKPPAPAEATRAGTASTGGEKPAEPQDFLHAAVFKALAAGIFKPEYRDATLLSQTLWSGLHGLVALHQVRGRLPTINWRPIQALTETMIECLLNGMIVPSAAEPPTWRRA